MCGIAGVVQRDGRPVEASTIAAMNATLRHRGPDSRGVHVDGSLGLGHTRLAVMDPTPAGHQPMQYGEGRYWLTYNGEVYNFLELRDSLEGLGHRFKGDCDTEVVLHAFAQWGAGTELRFNGEFAFAVWDSQARTLHLSRDRFGVKPLFYYWDGVRFAFASELKAFLALPWFEARFDSRAVASALSNFQAFEGMEESLFAKVRRLPAGHSLTLGPEGEPVIRRWWRTLDHLVDVPRDSRKQADRVHELLNDACALRLRADIPLGSTVSGGLDSSAVHCVVAELLAKGGHAIRRQAQQWDKAMVGLLPGWADEDRALAEEVIRYAGTKGVFRTLRPEDALDRIDDLIFHFEQIAPLPIGQWILYRALREENMLVSMEGHGPDEAFAGFRDGPKLAFLDTLERLHGYIAAMKKIGVKSESELPDLAVINAITRLPRGGVQIAAGRMIDTSVLAAEPYPYEYRIWREDEADLANVDALTRSLYFNFHCAKTPWILHDFEAASMGNGVEVRAPFLDWRLICFGFSLPAEAKIKDGLSKYPVRAAMAGRMPESVRLRGPKVGFPLPLYAWLGGPLKSFILDTVSSQKFLSSAHWNGPVVREAVEGAVSAGRFSALRPLWSFIQAERLIEQVNARAAVGARSSADPEDVLVASA